MLSRPADIPLAPWSSALVYWRGNGVPARGVCFRLDSGQPEVGPLNVKLTNTAKPRIWPLRGPSSLMVESLRTPASQINPDKRAARQKRPCRIGWNGRRHHRTNIAHQENPAAHQWFMVGDAALFQYKGFHAGIPRLPKRPVLPPTNETMVAVCRFPASGSG